MFKCKDCFFEYKTKLGLIKHKEKYHPKRHICQYCNTEFNHKQNKWRHEKICKKNDSEFKKIQNEKVTSDKGQNIQQTNLQKDKINKNTTDINTNIASDSEVKFVFLDWKQLLDLSEKNNVLNPMVIYDQLKIQDQQIKMQEEKIKKLENALLRKQKREQYADNVVYIVTTEENLANRIYIIGKAEKLADRLSTYNKTAEHTVVYYRHCFDKNTMGIVESMVLSKLDSYRERANRDRFCLPENKSISLFTNVIDQCVSFLCSFNNNEKDNTIKTNANTKIKTLPQEIDV